MGGIVGSIGLVESLERLSMTATEECERLRLVVESLEREKQQATERGDAWEDRCKLLSDRLIVLHQQLYPQLAEIRDSLNRHAQIATAVALDTAVNTEDIKRLRERCARLDWLEENAATAMLYGNHDDISMSRAAIDAALSAAKPQGGVPKL